MSNTAIHDEYSAKLFEGAEKDQERECEFSWHGDTAFLLS